MATTGLTRRDKTTIFLWVFVALAMAGIYYTLLDQATPEINLDLSVNRDEAVEIAHEFVESRGYELESFLSAVDFAGDYQSKNYLEKELTLADANRIMTEEAPVFYWRCRWYRPLDQEGFLVWISPEGEPVGFSHTVPDEAEGAALPLDEAQVLAAAFAESRGVQLDDYNLMTASSDDRPNRRDHVFRWEKKEFDAKDAKYEVVARVQGDEVGAFVQGVDVPEEWQRIENLKQSQRALLFRATSLVVLALQLIAVAILLLRLRDGTARYQFSLYLGLLVAIISTAAQLNEYATAWMYYPINTTPAAFVGQLVLQAVSAFFFNLVYVAVVAIAADSLARRAFPNHMPFSKMFDRRFWQTREVFIAACVGLAAMLVHAGFFASFYVGAKSLFGAWSPQQTPYNDILSTPYPFLHPLTVGLGAAVREELLYRALAIALLLRFTNSKTIAILVPAIIWGVRHSTYPQEPVYIRGLELTIVGVFYGIVFVRYGLPAVLISHFGYNALMSSAVLIGAETAYLQASGWVVVSSVFVVLIPGAVSILRGNGLRDGDNLRREPVEEFRVDLPPPQLPAPKPPARLTGRQLAFVSVLALIGVTAFIYLSTSSLSLAHRSPGEARTPLVSELSPIELRGISAVSGGREARINRVSRTGAETAARDYLSTKGVDLSSYYAVVTFNNGYAGTMYDYLYQHTGPSRYVYVRDELFPDGAYWHVRFYQPLSKEEYRVSVLPNGEAYSYTHPIAEDAEGANLPRDEALARASDHVTQTHKINLARYELGVDRSTEHDNRTDHNFAWELSDPPVRGLAYRVSANVQGGEVLGFSRYLDIAGTWRQMRNEQSTLDFAVDMIFLFAFIAVGMTAGAMFINCYLRGELQWRRWWPAAAGFTGLSLIAEANNFPTFWAGYSTSVQPTVYGWGEALTILETHGQIFITAWGAFTFTEALFRETFPTWQIAGRPHIRNSTSTADALIAGPGIALFVLGAIAAAVNIPVVYPAELPLPVNADAPALDYRGVYTTFLPALHGVIRTLWTIAVAVVAVALAGCIFRRIVRRWTALAILLAIVTALAAAREFTRTPDMMVNGLIAAMSAVGFVSLAALLCRTVLRENLMAYLSSTIASTLLIQGITLLYEPLISLKLLAFVYIVGLGVAICAGIAFRRTAGNSIAR